ncbi:MAG: BsuPI-related putative proteinase inhibitor [bacterium]|nr:BsuPI-related putative proteinase inhibitor [bacterium]MCS7309924.1 BsuPI-related putative proteinase inhibitor [Armatimonadota bacterium]MDW8104190.1 BsuPI-related putative proteinase inhibitor [Armatimonadota bacterium]
MRWVWLVVGVCVLTLPAGAQKPFQLQQVVQWQVVPELRVVELGKPVVFILEMRNGGATPIELRFSSGKQYDVLVYKQGEWSERWQWSKGKMFSLAVISLRLRAGEVRRFRVEWNQKDNEGRQVPPGDYRVEAILPLMVPPGRSEEIKASAQFSIRAPRRGVLRIRELIERANRWVGREVLLQGRNASGAPDPSCPMCADGPPTVHHDGLWVLRDETGCLYVTGSPDAVKTYGGRLLVVGIVRSGLGGRIYVEARQILPASP